MASFFAGLQLEYAALTWVGVLFQSR
jgi:hypothetical protein